MKTYFDHEKLNVYQDSIRFATWTNEVLEIIPKGLAVHNQLDRASTSIPLNISEGNGKFTGADRCKFFDIARGSALECAACLNVLLARKKITSEKAIEGKEILSPIVSMLVGLIKTTLSNRLYEEHAEYTIQRSD